MTIITAKVHPRAHGVDAWSLMSSTEKSGSSPCTRGGYFRQYFHHNGSRFIPVHTGRILNFLKNLCGYKITNPISNSYGRISMYHLFGMYFADNTFWSFFYYFRKKKRCRRHLFLILFPYHDILFCLHSSRVLHLTNALSFPVQ